MPGPRSMPPGRRPYGRDPPTCAGRRRACRFTRLSATWWNGAICVTTAMWSVASRFRREAATASLWVRHLPVARRPNDSVLRPDSEKPDRNIGKEARDDGGGRRAGQFRPHVGRCRGHPEPGCLERRKAPGHPNGQPGSERVTRADGIDALDARRAEMPRAARADNHRALLAERDD